MIDIRNRWIRKINLVLNPDSIHSNQRLIIFLICLFIATILWFLNALSKQYTTTINYPVRYVNLPKNKFIINDPPSKLQLRVNAFGFTLMHYKLSLTYSPVQLNITEIMEENRLRPGSFFNIQSATILENIRGQFSSDIQVIDVRPTLLQLVFDSLESRIVPVAHHLDLHFPSRFGQAGKVEIIPPKVEVTGPRAIVATIDTIFSQRKTFRNVKSDFQKEISLDVPDKLKASPEKVLVRIPVDEFTEKSFYVPIAVKSKPGEMVIRLFPREAEVSFSVPLKKFSEITPETLELYIKWEDVEKGLSHLPVYASYTSDGITSLKITPAHVEYLIERN